MGPAWKKDLVSSQETLKFKLSTRSTLIGLRKVNNLLSCITEKPRV